MLILQYHLIINRVIDDFSGFIESLQELAKIMLHQILIPILTYINNVL